MDGGRLRRRLLAGGIAALLGLAPACHHSSPDLLLVYSGDCQGYLDPCG